MEVVALKTRPLGPHDSTPRPGPSARLRARYGEISERQGCFAGFLRAHSGACFAIAALPFFH